MIDSGYFTGLVFPLGCGEASLRNYCQKASSLSPVKQESQEF